MVRPKFEIMAGEWSAAIDISSGTSFLSTPGGEKKNVKVKFDQKRFRYWNNQNVNHKKWVF